MSIFFLLSAYKSPIHLRHLDNLCFNTSFIHCSDSHILTFLHQNYLCHSIPSPRLHPAMMPVFTTNSSRFKIKALWSFYPYCLILLEHVFMHTFLMYCVCNFSKITLIPKMPMVFYLKEKWRNKWRNEEINERRNKWNKLMKRNKWRNKWWNEEIT